MTETTAQEYLAAAERARAQGDLEAALTAYRAAADRPVRDEGGDRVRVAALLALGLLLRESDRLPEAYQTFTEVIAKGEFGWGEAQLEKARLLQDTRFDPCAERGGGPSREDELFTAWRGARTAESRADQAEAHTELGTLLASQGELAAARESFDKAVLLDHALWSKRAEFRRNELPTDEPVVDEPVVDEPAVDEPVVDEAVVDEVPAVQPPADAPVTPAPSEDGLLGRLSRWLKGEPR